MEICTGNSEKNKWLKLRVLPETFMLIHANDVLMFKSSMSGGSWVTTRLPVDNYNHCIAVEETIEQIEEMLNGK